MTSLAQNLAFYRVSADDDVGVDENHHDEHQLNNNPPVASLDTTQNDEDVSDHDENDEGEECMIFEFKFYLKPEHHQQSAHFETFICPTNYLVLFMKVTT